MQDLGEREAQQAVALTVLCNNNMTPDEAQAHLSTMTAQDVARLASTRTATQNAMPAQVRGG